MERAISIRPSDYLSTENANSRNCCFGFFLINVFPIRGKMIFILCIMLHCSGPEENQNGDPLITSTSTLPICVLNQESELITEIFREPSLGARRGWRVGGGWAICQRNRMENVAEGKRHSRRIYGGGTWRREGDRALTVMTCFIP